MFDPITVELLELEEALKEKTFSKTNQVVELKDAPLLGDLIIEIFV